MMNGQWLQWIKDMRDGEETSSNKYVIYNKALNSLKKQTKEYHDPDSLLEVKFIGPGIIQHLKRRWNEAGRVSSMDEASSALPSRTKRRKISGGAPSSQAKQLNRPFDQRFIHETDAEDGYNALPEQQSLVVPPHLQHAFGNVSSNLNFQHPPPHEVQALGNFYPHAHFQHQPPREAQALENPYSDVHSQHQLPHEAQALAPFDFIYIDSNRQQVESQDMAEVDIHEGVLWYRLGYIDSGEPNTHPLARRIRPILPNDVKRKRGLLEGWISDQDVEYYGLHIASGLPQVPGRMGIGATPQSAGYSQLSNPGPISWNNRGNPKPTGSQEGSLGDLLDTGEKKKYTIDSDRVTATGKEWSSHASGSKKDTVETQARSKNDEELDVFMERRSAMSSVSELSAARVTSSTSSTLQLATWNSITNPSLKKANTLSETSFTGQSSTLPSCSAGAPVSAAAGNTGPSVSKEALKRANTAPAISSSAMAVSKPKPQQKRRDRGRVSNFAPALPAVDDFDLDLDRQAANHRIQVEHVASTSTSHISADLIDDVTDLTSSTVPTFPTFDPIVFPANSFEVVLVLDSREVKSQRNRDHIVLELRKRGVNVEQRSLPLGDVLWIARRRDICPQVESNECVLNYILERKRLDDLCLSIKDGRFHEQKHRLSNTGLKVFYLIEDYDLEKNRERFGIQIDTARSSTQVVDGFIVKETTKLSSTIDYLAMMHQTILEVHQGKALYVIPPHVIKRHSYMALQKHLRIKEPGVVHLTSYICFEGLNSKSANLTARDILAQMLLCVRGLSPEKVAAIIETYPTVRSLWEAFRMADAAEQQGLKRQREEDAAAASSQGNKGKRRKKNAVPLAKEMLCSLEGSGRKRIGPVLSANIYRLLRANTYDD